MSQKRIILSDSSLNRYGYRVLTEGLNIEAFRKNPIMLYMHFRDEGSPLWGESKAIGHWEDIQINGDELSAVPIFDMVDELSKTVAAKYEAGTFSATSIGFRIIATSANKELLVPGQTRETVTESELMEASIVDVPGNSNAVRLYDKSSFALLAAGMDQKQVPELKQKSTAMKFRQSWLSFLSYLKIDKDQAENTELTAENIESLHSQFSTLTAENQTLVQAKTNAEASLATANGEITTLKTEIGTKEEEITRLKNEATTKDNEITQLKQQVINLKGNPPDGEHLTPPNEPGAEGSKDTLSAYCEKNPSDYKGITDQLKSEGLI